MKKQLKKKSHKEIFKIGSEHIDFYNLNLHEASTIAIVGILSVTVGAIYGQILFT